MQPRTGGFQFLSLRAALLGVVVTPAGRWDDHDPTVHSPAIPPDQGVNLRPFRPSLFSGVPLFSGPRRVRTRTRIRVAV